MASQTQKDKEKFFSDLYALEELTGEDEIKVSLAECKSRKPELDARQGSRSGDRRSDRGAGSSGSGLETEMSRDQDTGSVDEKSTLGKRVRGDGRSRNRMPPPPRLVASKTTPGISSIPAMQPSESIPSLRRIQTEDVAPKTNKRARKKQPELPQIFAGQIFFFVPNDNRAVPRKRRIDKAILHGANWARAWVPGVTHIIVESDRKLNDLVKLTGHEHVPAEVSIVWDTWLTESLGYKEMRDSTARRFQVKNEHRFETSKPVTELEKDSFEEHSRASSEELIPDDTQKRPRDALDGVYEEAKATQYLPLDFDGEVTSTGSFGDAEPNITEGDLEMKKWYQCMLKNDGKTEDTNPNSKAMGILQEMANLYDRMGDHWRTISYRKAIAALRKQKIKIETKEQAQAIPQIGERLADKIEEIVSTNKLQRLVHAKSDPNEQTMQLFMSIYGVGLAVASKWIARGHRTLEDIRTKVDLTTNQRIGLEHREDFESRIPRAEVAEHARIVRDALRKFDPAFQLIVGGSYRRGKSDSGDIDCLITKTGASIEYIRTVLLESVVPFLFRIGFLKAALATSHNRDDGSKWHGASALPNSKVWRRIDLLFVPWDEFGAAFIYFTGNDIFNRSIRLLASKKGMRLNQHGLYKDVMRGRQRDRITEGTLLEGQSEQKIFEILGVPWRLPEDRNC